MHPYFYKQCLPSCSAWDLIKIKCSVIVLAAFFTMNSCTPRLETTQARQLVEHLFADLKNEHYEELDNYYTTSANVSTPLQAKIEKFIRLQDTTGPILSYTFVKEEKKTDADQLVLIYKVECSRVTLKETITLEMEEGKAGIVFQTTENWEEVSVDE